VLILKKTLSLLLTLSIFSSSTTTVFALSSTNYKESLVAFNEDSHLNLDPNLELLIRKTIHKPEGIIQKSDLEKINQIICYESYNIKSLQGIENLVNLERLILHFNPVENLEPLKGLKKLKHIEFYAGDSLEDISPLKELTNLEILSLGHNKISNITALKKFKQTESIKFK
jgi:hypothetical protein